MVSGAVPISFFEARQVLDICDAAMNHFWYQSSLLDLDR
jgi:hypothetical protein